MRPKVDPRWCKDGSMRGPFSKGLILQIGMQQQQTESILVSWIEISWLFAVRPDFTNLTGMLSDLQRNLTFNRSVHCTQVSNQCPLGLLLSLNLNDTPGLAPHMNDSFWRPGDFPVSFSNRDNPWNAWNRHSVSLMVDIEIFRNLKSPSHEC